MVSTWGEYSGGVFGEIRLDWWNFMFAGTWDKADDTPWGAAARIAVFLTEVREGVFPEIEGSAFLSIPYQHVLEPL